MMNLMDVVLPMKRFPLRDPSTSVFVSRKWSQLYFHPNNFSRRQPRVKYMMQAHSINERLTALYHSGERSTIFTKSAPRLKKPPSHRAADCSFYRSNLEKMPEMLWRSIRASCTSIFCWFCWCVFHQWRCSLCLKDGMAHAHLYEDEGL